MTTRVSLGYPQTQTQRLANASTSNLKLESQTPLNHSNRSTSGSRQWLGMETEAEGSTHNGFISSSSLDLQRHTTEVSYETACAEFARCILFALFYSYAIGLNANQACITHRYLNSPLTSLVAGRGVSQVTFLIHTSIVQPHPSLYKLCKASPSTHGVQSASMDPSSPTTQIILKDYDPQIVSSLLSYLYTTEYWPEMSLLNKKAQELGTIPDGTYLSSLFSAHAITSHHFKLALLASKFSLDPLLLLCREKVITTLSQIPPRELLELVRSLYSKEHVLREQFFELISYPGSAEGRNDLKKRSRRDSIWPGVNFWTKDILQKLMSQNGQSSRPQSPLDSVKDDGGTEELTMVPEEFLKMVAVQGGDLARDVVRAF